MSRAYYNEFDPKAAAWLRELIKQGLIAPGDVDERSITEVQPNDLTGYTQCHFFAGIGGWSYALRLASVSDDEPIWTGSCPCQPFSAAGKGLGDKDERHLWPEFFRLTRECRPATVFGEQVASAIGHGWLDGICADLEGEGYACGSAVLGAHSVGAPHIRQRLYWVADAESERRCGRGEVQGGGYTESGGPSTNRPVADSNSPRPLSRPHAGIHCGEKVAWTRDGESERCGAICGLGHADIAGPQGRGLQPGCEPDFRAPWSSDFDLLPCTDGKTRRTQSGIFPLAHGVSARVGRLRGYGNAIVPQVAAEFVSAARSALIL